MVTCWLSVLALTHMQADNKSSAVSFMIRNFC